ncbi:MAG: hypothetical protein QW727_02950 [Candidatus Pacearchaeota archaeon]
MQRVLNFLVSWSFLLLSEMPRDYDYMKEIVPESVSNFNLFDALSGNTIDMSQKWRIKFMSDLMKEEKIRKRIGELVENDLNDKYSEHGGIIHLRFGGVYFENIESVVSGEKSEKNNTKYVRNYDFKKGIFAEYHIHAVYENSSFYSFPSMVKYEEGRLYGDVLRAFDMVVKFGEYHAFLFTKIEGKKFNVDYYGGKKDYLGKPTISIVDIGDFEY